jgi:hypothetical protein
MNTYKVRHVVLCKVQAWSIVNAENFDMALAEVAKITIPTSSGNGYYYDHEVISDEEIISIDVKIDKD